MASNKVFWNSCLEHQTKCLVLISLSGFLCLLFYTRKQLYPKPLVAEPKFAGFEELEWRSSAALVEDPVLQYTWHDGSRLKVGKKLNVSHELLRSLGLPFTDHFVNLTHSNVRDFVFVTAASDNHFVESIDAVAGVQRFMPNHTIIYYDLGLKDKNIQRVNSWCRVIYRKFNFTKYPPIVKYLSRSYSFKPMIVKEVLETYPGVMWMDSSYRLQKGGLQPVLDLAVKNGGFVQFHHSPHSMYAATYPTMWDILVTDPAGLQRVDMMGANSMLMYKTEKIYTRVLHWWMLCALDVECVTPTGSNRNCPHPPDMNTVSYHYEACHRQDQSSIGTLVANLYNFELDKYVPVDSKQWVILCKTALKRVYKDGQKCH